MKVFGIVLAIFGVLNIVRGIGIMSNGSIEAYSGQGMGLLLLGFVFIGGSIYSFHRVNQKQKEKDAFDKWNNSNERKE